ncbi:hypothetical protein Amet_4031 [Alkaliphilus metalliredigens QYMF]|uniref:Uncharacterized protein n=1 Tax=Alkaliphilus metalliredigens (strain QYMF) TaxID=293826 RepID=A6TV95_ALKMQ|nr:hypothetical protein [Alkaliphilus metalliredigens]ABR50113.1 hypothetical protein Amet_4031 [Alkaliphilus metalliredigens QYMF]
MDKKLTDEEILKKIYNRHSAFFSDYLDDSKPANNEIYVSIDIEELAKELSVDSQLIFRRLYYHIDKILDYTHTDGSRVHLYTPIAGENKNVIHLPLLGAIVETADEIRRRKTYSVVFSAAKVIILLAGLSVIIYFL